MPYLTSDEYERMGRELVLGGRPDEALQVFKEAIARYPSDKELHVGLGMAHLRRGDYVLACEILESLRDFVPSREHALQGLTEAYLKRGRPREALRDALEALAGDSLDAELAEYLGRLFFEARHFDAAASVFRLAIRRGASHAPLFLGYGACLQRMGDLKGAEESVRRAITENAVYWEAHCYLASLLYRQGRKAEAKVVYEGIPLDGFRDPAAVKRALELIEGDADKRRRLEELLGGAPQAPRGTTGDPQVGPLPPAS